MSSSDACPAGAMRCTYVGRHAYNDAIPEQRLELCLAPGETTPSAATRAAMRDRLADIMSGADRNVIGSDVQVTSVQCLPSAPRGDDAADARSDALDTVLRRKMSRSCGPTFDVSDAVQLQTFDCQYRGPYKDDDGVIRMASLARSGRLHSCDRSEHDVRATADDIRDVVAYKLGGSERAIDKTQITCNIMSMPQAT